MLKRLVLCCASLLVCGFLQAETIPLSTGRWVIDTYRNVNIDEFDYLYTVKNIYFHDGVIELEDGSLWQVEPMAAETKSFYRQKNIRNIHAKSPSLFGTWDSGDVLIFHKVVNRDSILAYNVTRDMLLDVTPIAAGKSPFLTIDVIQNTNIPSTYLIWDSAKKEYKQYHTNTWITVIRLSDGTTWQLSDSKPSLQWLVGDPVHVAKDTPWWSSNTHILILMKPARSHPDQTPTFQRLGVWRAS